MFRAYAAACGAAVVQLAAMDAIDVKYHITEVGVWVFVTDAR